MSAREFLDRLEKDQLLEETVVADLRRQLREASRGVTAESIAKLLVDNGHLTRFQASKLINEVTAEIERKKGQRAEETETKRAEVERKATTPPRPAPAADDDLLLAPPPAAPAEPGKASRPKPPPRSPAPTSPAAPAEDELILLDPDEDAKAARAAKPKPPSSSAASKAKTPEPPPPPAAPAPARDPVWIDEGPALTPLGPATEPKSGPQPVAPGRSTGLEPLAVETVADEALLDSDVPRPAPAVASKKKRLRDNPWDSPLMLVGGGVLVILVLLSYALYRSMTRGTAQEIFAAAEEDYKGGAYTNAIEKYEQMLESFPYDADAGKARVKVQMARLRMAAEGARDPKRALEAAQEILPPLKEEGEFGIVRDELATLLPDIALAFAERARKAKSMDEAEQLLGSVTAAMELVNDPAYIPTSLRKSLTGVINRVEETAALVRRDIDRQQELAAVLANMDQSIKSGQSREAYRLRDELVAKHPVLQRHPQILEKIGEVSQLERDLVQVNQQTVEGLTDDPATASSSVVVYTRSGAAIPGLADQTAVVLARGSVYGLDAASGKVLWRRFAGHDAAAYPQPIAPEPQSDVIMAQAAEQEVLRVEARTGNVVWRVPIGEAFHPPVVWRDRVLVTTHSGQVWNIDAASGRSSRQTNLAQQVPTEIGADSKVAQLYQVGENDNLYVLSPESMECREVYYLGHRPGMIRIPPTPAVGMLFVVMNTGPDFSFVYPLSMNDEGLGLAPAQDPIRLNGHVLRPPAVVGRRLIYTTTLGAIHVLDVNPQEKRPVVEDIKPAPPSRSEGVVNFALAEQGKLWSADQRLMLYDVQASQGQLARRWVEYDGDTFVGPLQRFGPALVHVRRAASAPGFRIAAINAEDPKTVYWQTDVAAPVLEMFAGSGGVSAVTARGSVITVTDETLGQGLVEAPGDARVSNLIFQSALELPDGRHVIFSRSSRVLIYDPSQPDKQMRLLRVIVPEGAAETKPIIVSGGLAVPLRTGQIALLDLNTGDNQVLPFQPPLEAGQGVDWLRPAGIGAPPQEFVAADDQQHLYRVGIVDSGRPHLEALETVTVDQQLVTPLVGQDKFVWAGVRRSDSDALQAYGLPRLKAETNVPLQGRITWGPEKVGDALLVATDAEGLVCLSSSGERRWAVAVPAEGVAGVAPIQSDFLLAAGDGTVLQLEASSGREVARHEVGEPLAGQPVASGQHWWVATYDGTLYRLPALEAAASAGR